MSGAAALLEVGAGCDADCVFCRRNETRRLRGALPAEPDFAASASFLELARRLGLDRLIVGGDEPTMIGAAALCRLVRPAARLGFKPAALYSNGIALGGEGAARRLCAAGFGEFYLPLYGADAAGHDAVTRRDGSFAALSRAVAALRGRGARVFLHTVVLRANQAALPAMRELAEAWGAPLEEHELSVREDPVPYRALRPRRARPARARRRGPAEAELRFSVLLGRLNYGRRAPAAVRRLLAGALPRRLRAGLSGFEAKPAFRDPARLLALLDGRGRPELLAPGDAVEALRVGLRALRAGDRSLALAALEEALLFEGGGRQDWARGQARALLERLWRTACRG